MIDLLEKGNIGMFPRFLELTFWRHNPDRKMSISFRLKDFHFERKDEFKMMTIITLFRQYTRKNVDDIIDFQYFCECYCREYENMTKKATDSFWSFVDDVEEFI